MEQASSKDFEALIQSRAWLYVEQYLHDLLDTKRDELEEIGSTINGLWVPTSEDHTFFVRGECAQIRQLLELPKLLIDYLKGVENDERRKPS